MAQNGYVVTFKKDTVAGTVELQDLKVKPGSVHTEARTEFRRLQRIEFTDKEGNSLSYMAGDVVGFGIDGNYYQSISIPDKQGGATAMKLVFARVLEQGKVTLYSVDGVYAKIEAGGSVNFQDFSHQYITSHNASISRLQGGKKKIVEMLVRHFADQPDIVARIKDKKWKRTELEEVVRSYNQLQ